MSVEKVEVAADPETVSAWQSHFAGANDPGMTCNEIAKACGVSRSTMWDRLMRGVEEGKYVMGKAKRIAHGGTEYSTTVFQLVEAKKARKR